MGLGKYQSIIEKSLESMRDDGIVERIWEHDHTVWKPEPAEISNRLGWLDVVENMRPRIPTLQAFVQKVIGDGFTNALLLGMGGSSLAPEVFRKTFGVEDGYLDLAVLDSTDPGAVLECTRELDLKKTLFIAATKSGGTVETLSFFKYFYNLLIEESGPEIAGQHFVAITDPGSKLVDLAVQYKFRKVFLNDPNIGGRFSALSYFGLLPAALIGVDIDMLLDRAGRAADAFRSSGSSEQINQSAYMGAVMGELAKLGRDKLTLFISREIASFGDWLEQLIAESTGKEEMGILPVVGEEIAKPGQYGDDRIFIHIQLNGDPSHGENFKTLETTGHPVVRLPLEDVYDLGSQVFLWEFATAVAGHLLGINPFDQPNVEAAKNEARQMVSIYKKQGSLPKKKPIYEDPKLAVYGSILGDNPEAILSAFLNQAQDGAYVCLQAFLEPTEGTNNALSLLRSSIQRQTHLATTVGFGPRYLHSTGQLHKGDAGNGLFIQFTSDHEHDADIPDEAGSNASSMSFGVLELAQALGDGRALESAGRSVIRYHMYGDVNSALKKMSEVIL